MFQIQITSLRIKFIDRTIFLSFCCVMAFLLSVFFGRDIKHLVWNYYNTDFLNPVHLLIVLLPIFTGLACIISLLISVRKNILQQTFPRISSRTVAPVILLAIFVTGVVFSNQIVIARELIEFKLHEQAFQQLAAFSQIAYDTCNRTSKGCVDPVELPSSLDTSLGHKLIGIVTSPDGYRTILFQDINERETDFNYIVGNHPNLGSTVGIRGTPVECYYQIDDHWFLCTEYSRDI